MSLNGRKPNPPPDHAGRNMSVEEIIQRLEVLGIEQEAARAYVHVALVGSCKASELALSIGSSRTEAYRILRSLVEDGFVTSSLERPVRFTAQPLRAVIERLNAEDELRRDALRRADDIIAALATLRAEPSPDLAKSTFRIVESRPEIFKAVMHAIQGSRNEIASIMTNPSSAGSTDYFGVWDQLHEKALQGTRVRVLRSPDETLPANLLADAPSDAEFRTVHTGGHVNFLIGDGEQMVIVAVSDATERLMAENEVAIVTNAPDFVFAHQLLFEELWQRSSRAA